MRLIAFAFVAAITITACNKKTGHEETTSTSPGTPFKQECYSYANKDTITMNITIKDKVVTGGLSYNFFEKDRNKGTIKGTMEGDTIFAEYTFQSEGTTSVREVAFLKKGKWMKEGYGPLNESGTYFTNHRNIEFNGIELQQTDCN